MSQKDLIRNFSIIAHIDHGKSTLADRLIQHCGGLEQREMTDRVLDNMDLEKERGITIKAQTVRLHYKAQDGKEYILNLMDTPGHVDFSYEVSRCLSACEGALLVVDASQGVEAQTLANVYLALENDLELLPVLNKIDLPAAEPERVISQIEDVVGIPADHALRVSAKSGIGITDLLEEIIKTFPAPEGDPNAALRALLVDSWYDPYLGVVCLVRVYEGQLRRHDQIKMMSTGAGYQVDRIGFFSPKMVDVDVLMPGEVGYLIASIKTIQDCKVGDTITLAKSPCKEMLPGFKPSLPVVFCGLFPIDAGSFQDLRDSLDKLSLNDSSFVYSLENSTALGLGFRCGFLGLLHLEIIKERLEREFNIDLISTAPSVIYNIYMKDGEIRELHNPSDFPDVTTIERIEEPWIKGTIMVPEEYVGDIISLCTGRRGVQKDMTYVGDRLMLIYEMPLNEIVFDFYDRLKSVSRGYASFDYDVIGYREGDLVKVQILINGDKVDALSMLLHRSFAEARGRVICEKLKTLIPRQLYQIAIQAAIGGKIIARETVSALRKDVTAKCYGGDITRKRKLLEKQKEGKKKMRSIGKIDIPQSAFIQALKTDD